MIRPRAILALLVAATILRASPAARAADSQIPRRDAEPVVRAVLAHPYAFCNDRHVPLGDGDLRWRELLQSRGARAHCPDVADAWARTAAPRSRPTETHDAHGGEIQVPAAGPVLQMAFWVALGLLGVLGVASFTRQGVTFGRNRPRERPSAPDAPVPGSAAPPTRAVETDIERLLALARAGATAGRFEEAIGNAYAALLRGLAGAGLVRIEPNRTNGDHLREVGRKARDLAPPIAATIVAVEEVQFGGVPADAPRFQAVYDGVVQLRARRFGAPMAVLLVLAIGAALGGCAIAKERRDESASGHAAAIAFLRQYGFDVRERLGSLSSVHHDSDQVVVLPEATVDEGAWKSLEAWVDDGGTLFVAGGERPLPDWIGVAIEPGAASGTLSSTLEQRVLFEHLNAVVPPGQTLRLLPAPHGEWEDGPAQPVLLRGTSLYAVEQGHGEGHVVVLADDSLFENAALIVDNDADLLADLLRRGGKRIEVAAELSVAGATTPLASVERGRLAPALIQVGLFLLLFFGWRGAHFGQPVDPIGDQRRAFSQHVRAVGVQYARAHASGRALELYGGYALERLRERLQLARGKGIHAVAEAVAARSGRPIGDVMRLLVAGAPGAAPEGTGTGNPDDLASIREIAALLNEIGGVRERTGAGAEG